MAADGQDARGGADGGPVPGGTGPGDPRNSNSLDLVEALTDASDHLDFALRLVRRTVADQDRLTELTRRIREIESRLHDNRYRLAVIGEFSSGKTTFINALLGEDLLPTSALRTTGAATRIGHGPELSLTVRFRGDGLRYVYPSGRHSGPDSPLGRMLSHIAPGLGGPGTGRPGPGVPHDTAGILRLLTSHEDLAPLVDLLEVRHPAPALRDGLVIIDTPGTNAEEGHTGITTAVMRDEADLAAVLTPATAAAPASLSEFLLQALDGPMLGRCTFLVTKMDHIDEDEQEDLLTHVRGRLVRTLGLADPVVAPVAAEPVVRRATGRPFSGPEQVHWADEFPRTVRRLRDLMQRQRVLAASDHLLRLLEDLLTELEGDLQTAARRLDEEGDFLARVRNPDLPGFAARQGAHGAALLAEAAGRARQAVGGMPGQWEQYARRAVDEALDAARDGEELRRVVRSDVPDLMRRELPRIGDLVQSTVSRTLSAAADRAREEVDRAFAAEYAKLPRAPLHGAAGRQVTVLSGGRLADEALRTYEEGTVGVTGQFAAVGDPGAVRNPGAAQAPGAARDWSSRLSRLADAFNRPGGSPAGSLAGSPDSRPTLRHTPAFGVDLSRNTDRRRGTPPDGSPATASGSSQRDSPRNQARSDLHQSLRTVAERLVEQIDEAIAAAVEQYTASVHEQVDDYRAAYERAVAGLADEYRSRETTLAARRNLLADAGRQMQRRRATAVAQRGRLARRGAGTSGDGAP